MRQPLSLRCRPEASTRMPAFCSSSWYLPISSNSRSLGITPASESFVAFTMLMTRMSISFNRLNFGFGFFLCAFGRARFRHLRQAALQKAALGGLAGERQRAFIGLFRFGFLAQPPVQVSLGGVCEVVGL